MAMDCSEDLAPVDMMSVHQMTAPSLLMGEVGVCAGGRGSGELGRRLLLAARHGDTQAVLDLMARGAPFTTDWLGTSALHVAAGSAHVQTCAVLLRAGVSRDCRTKVDRTPLHLAAHAGHADVAQLLLDNHAAVDCRDMLQMTPLHWAVERGHAATARVLVAAGADWRATSKFNKTPASLAAQRGRRDLLALFQEAEAGTLAPAPRAENETSTEKRTQTSAVYQLSEGSQGKPAAQPEPIKINIERPLETGEEANAAAAAMLRRHGITLLPADEGSTVLSALQSGRSVVLSDAGKLMLKESGEIPQLGKAPAAAGKGVLLTATPVKSPPKQGVKIFTLNNKPQAAPKENKAPVKKVINPHDSMQIQYIKLPSDAKITPKAVPVKAKTEAVGAGPAVVARPTVKVMMQKANLNKLAENGLDVSPVTSPESRMPRSDDRNVLFVPEEFLINSSPKYLRTQLLTAHKTIASLNSELSALKARLAKYEKI